MTVLCIAPHPDDLELGAGGYVAKLVEEGASVHVVALADCRESLPAGWLSNTLYDESRAAGKALGVRTSVVVGGFTVRTMPAKRQEVLDFLIEMRETWKPDLVLCPSPADCHQDHHQTALECIRAFRCSVWGWITPWNVADYHTRGFVRLEERHLEAKLQAAACYESQRTRPYMNPVVIRAWAQTVGLQAGCPLSESYDILRHVA